MTASKPVAVLLVALAILIGTGSFAVLAPRKLHSWHLDLYERYPGIRGADPFLDFRRSEAHVVLIRLIGAVELAFALLVMYILIR